MSFGSNPRVPFMLSTARPKLAAPHGKRLIVHIVINLETWPFNEPMPRSIFQSTHGKPASPDIGNFCWVEYGLRNGVPRLIRILGERNLSASNFMNASLPDVYPECAEAALKAGWEVSGHQIVQRSLQHEPDEELVIQQVVEKLTKFCGYRPRGWLGPGAGETLHTPDILKKHGFEYLFEWIVDDVPVWMKTKYGPMIAMPYALELNDVMTFTMHNYSAEEYVKRFEETIKVFESELDLNPRVLTIALHPHIIMTPFRIPSLTRILDMLMKHDDVIFMTGGQIADWFKDQDPEGYNAAS